MQLRTPAPVNKGGAKPGSNNGGGAKPGSTKPKGSGRAVGTQNKITLTAKAAIAEFVDGNAHRLEGWLDKVANGEVLLDKDGKPVYDSEGNPVYLVRPNPERAFNLFQSVVEYHVPKLARSELTGLNGGAIQTRNIDLKGLNDAELAAMEKLMVKAAGQA
jgi:hypothetical protein